MYIYRQLKKKFLIIYRSSNIIIKLAIIDQITKWCFITYLLKKPGLRIKVLSFLEMVYSWNYGVSFGMFKNYHQYSNALFIVLNSLITAYLSSEMLKGKSSLSFLGYSCIIGGAISNIIDRIFRGAVFDFIYFHYSDYSLPIFNLADSFISIGVAVLIYDHYKVKKSIEKKVNRNYDQPKIAAKKIGKLDVVSNNLSIEER